MSGRGQVNFEVFVTVPVIEPEYQHKVRVGMSANLQVMIYSNPRAIMVPIGAVAYRGNRKTVEALDQSTQQFREVEVTTGITDLTSVEIVSGLKEGDQIAPSRN